MAEKHHELTPEELKRIVAEADTGGRQPTGVAAMVIAAGALAWSLFQLWQASPFPYLLGIGLFNDTEARSLHLAFAVFLGFLSYPAFKRSPRDRIPLADWLFAAIAAGCMAYLFLFYRELSTRPGQPTVVDLTVAVTGMALLLEAVRRALGLPMVILALVFLTYIFFGPYMPEMIAHKGASLSSMLAAYVALIKLAAHYPELRLEDPNEPLEALPDAGPTIKSGLHYLLPVAALIWNLMVEELSPALSVFWAIGFLMFIVVTQKPLFAYFRGTGNYLTQLLHGLRDLYDGLVIGARNMIGIGIATAAAGIIVGTVTLTGIGLVLTEVVETIAGGNLILMLLLVAVICLILGMGLPTTANYIVVSTLMAPVVVEIGAQNGLLVPLIAVHLFVFYFGLMADVTPPVGLASYAAAGIAKCDPIRTGVTAFGYSISTPNCC